MKKTILRILFASVLALCGTAVAPAQALWLDAGVSKTWQKRYTVGADVQYRTTDALRTTDRWSVGAGFAWKPLKWLKVGADYSFISQHRLARTTRKGNLVDDCWQPRHRVGIDVTGSLKFGFFSLSLRERWQYTRQQGVNARKYDPDGNDKGWEYIAPKNRHVWRSRLKLEWGIRKKCPFTPYVSAEMYNSLNNGFAVAKMRYTGGCDYKINRHNSVGLYYRFVDSFEAGDRNLNVIGAEYNFKF